MHCMLAMHCAPAYTVTDGGSFAAWTLSYFPCQLTAIPQAISKPQTQ